MEEINIEVLDKETIGLEVETAVKEITPALENLYVLPSNQLQEFKSQKYYGYDKVTVEGIMLQDKVAIPTTEQQTIISDENYTGLREVMINPVTNEIDSNIQSSNIKAGVSILGVEGNLEPDKPNQSKNVLPTKEEQIIVADDGFELEQVTVSPIPENYVEPTGTLEITENGTHDVTNYKEVKADIHEPTPFAPPFISFYGMGIGDYPQKLTQEMIDSIDTSNITSMLYMFSKTDGNSQSFDLSKWNTENVKSMSQMFAEANNIRGVNMKGLNTSKVTTMSYMFYFCQGVNEIDLSGLDTSKVTNMSYMFNTTNALRKLNLEGFDTSKVTNMSYMFQNCGANNLEDYFDLSGLNTSNVTNMMNMFGNYKLKTLDISNFDYSSVTNMGTMFSYSYNLENLNMGNSSAQKVNRINNMFSSCEKLTNLTFCKDLGKGYTQKSFNYSYYKLDLSVSTNLTHDSLMDVINKLYDLNLTYNVANGGTLYTQQLVLGSTNLAKLTADEIAIATNKGWTVS